MKLLTHLFLVLLILTVLACDFTAKKRVPEYAQRMKQQREVKKVSEADIINTTKKLGDSISQVATEIFLTKMTEKFAEGGYKAAAKYCSMNAYPLTDSLASQYDVFLKRVSNKNRNPQNVPAGVEEEVLEAFEYSANHNDKLGANVQFVRPGDTILYNKPIRIPSELCLNCHGNSSQISEEVQAVLSEDYPNDKAVGYKVGDLRGMWSLKFLRKNIVQEM